MLCHGNVQNDDDDDDEAKTRPCNIRRVIIIIKLLLTQIN